MVATTVQSEMASFGAKNLISASASGLEFQALPSSLSLEVLPSMTIRGQRSMPAARGIN